MAGLPDGQITPAATIETSLTEAMQFATDAAADVIVDGSANGDRRSPHDR